MISKVKHIETLQIGFILAAVTAFFTVVSCKPMRTGDTGSDTKTLDNLSGKSKWHPNVCGHESAAPREFDSLRGSIRVDAAHEADLKAALGAVPEKLRAIFFSELRGYLVVDTNEALAKCGPELNDTTKKFLNEAGRSNFIACPYRNPAAGRWEIYVSADHDAIRHTLLRTFSYVYSAIVLKGLSAAPANATAGGTTADPTTIDALQNESEAHENALKLLTAAFYQDVGSQSPGVGIDPDAFSRIVFAEAMDSYYCNPDTHKLFADQTKSAKFPATYGVFTASPVAGGQTYAQIFGPTYFGP